MTIATAHFDVVIVGGGHGGAQSAIALRDAGFDGSIAIINREMEMPYERPPLSKDYLAKECQFEKLYFHTPEFWREKGIQFLLGKTVTAVNPENQTVSCTEEAEYHYNDLIWATGGDPRRLMIPGFDLDGVHSIRGRQDVDAIMRELDAAVSIVVVGGGYIGLEAAAVFTKLGKKVVLLESAPRVLARVSGQDLSDFYESDHRAHGVDLRVDQKIVSLVGGERVEGVELEDGEVLPADMVIAGVGIDPAIGPLVGAGANCANGVVVDAQCRTSLPGIYAIGDCAAHQNRFAGGDVVRLESVQNANDMARVAARTICGEETQYQATPWFWSSQYDLKLQTVGLATGFDQSVVRGDPNARKFSVVYLKNGRVVALDCVNNARDYSHGRRLVELGVHAKAEEIADSNRQLKEWAKSPSERRELCHD